MSKKSRQDFINEYGPIAEQVGREIGVDPNVILSQWALESQWGSKVPARNNVAGIKDFSGKGVAAKDNKLGTIDKYVQFEDPEVFGMYYADMIKRQFPNAVNTGPDIGAFTRGLISGRSGSYFQADPQQYAVGLTAIHNSIPGVEQSPRPEIKNTPATETDDEIFGTLDDMRREELERSDLEAQERRQAQLYGGGAGAAFSAARGAGAAGGSLLRSVARSLEEGKQSAGAPPAAPGALGTSTAPARPTAPTAAAVPSVVRQGALPGQTGLRQPPPIPGLALTGNVVSPYAGHGSASANYGWKFGLPDIELENVRNMGSGEEGAQGAVKRQEAGMARARAAVPGSVIVERPSGILETISTGGKPKFTGTQLGPMPTDPGDPRNMFPAMSQPGDVQPRVPQQPQRVPTSTATPAPSTLERVSEGFRNMMRSAASGFAAAGRYVAPPLAIASAAGEGANIAQQFRRPSSSALDAPGQPMVGAGKERDYTSTGLSAGNILGGALSLVPKTSIPGIVLSAGTAAIQAYRDNPEAREFIVRKLQEASQTPFSDPMTGKIYP
jgi:hypothetical protein